MTPMMITMAPLTPTTQMMTATVFQMKMTKIVILMATALLTSVSLVKNLVKQ